MRKTTTDVKLLVRCKDRRKQLIPLRDLKESNPVEVAEYAEIGKIGRRKGSLIWSRQD